MMEMPVEAVAIRPVRSLEDRRKRSQIAGTHPWADSGILSPRQIDELQLFLMREGEKRNGTIHVAVAENNPRYISDAVFPPMCASEWFSTWSFEISRLG